MKESELLGFIPRATPLQRGEALAALFLRFGHPRDLGSLAKWKDVWQWFPRADFECRAIPRPMDLEGPMQQLDGDENAEGTNRIEVAPRTRLELTLALSSFVEPTEFAAILRGASKPKVGVRVVGALCYWELQKNGRRYISTEIAPP